MAEPLRRRPPEVSRNLLLDALRRLPPDVPYAELDEYHHLIVEWTVAEVVAITIRFLEAEVVWNFPSDPFLTDVAGLKLVSVLDVVAEQTGGKRSGLDWENLDWEKWESLGYSSLEDIYDTPEVENPDDVRPAVAVLLLPAASPEHQRWSLRTTTAAWLSARRSPHTRRAYLRDLADFLAWLDTRHLAPADVRRGDVDRYLGELRDCLPPPSPATERRRLAALSSWYTYLQDHDLVLRNPVTTVDRPPIDRDSSPTVSLTVAEVQTLLHAADQEANRPTGTEHRRHAARRNQVLLGVLTTLGLRVGEAIALDISHLRHNAGHRTLLVPGKGGRIRELPIPAPLGRHLDAYLALRVRARRRAALREAHEDRLRQINDDSTPGSRWTGPWRKSESLRQLCTDLDQLDAAPDAEMLPIEDVTKPLFITAAGTRLRQAYVFAMLRRYAVRAGLPTARVISPHSLRHTAATAALDAGATLRDVQDFLGHADPRTTRRYDRNRGSLDRSPVHRLAVLYAE
jgi:site-specific recombinase XerD